MIIKNIKKLSQFLDKRLRRHVIKLNYEIPVITQNICIVNVVYKIMLQQMGFKPFFDPQDSLETEFFANRRWTL